MSEREWHNSDWKVYTNKGAILDAKSTDQFEEELGIPMPEMLFGQNYLRIVHVHTKAEILFTAKDALKTVEKNITGKPSALQVAHSTAWREAKIRNKALNPVEPGVADYDVDRVHKPFDWTYSTSYQGTMAGFEEVYQSRSMDDYEVRGIPYRELERKVPLEFVDSLCLFEDELGDCGLCTYTVKVRAMEQSMFVLARMFMRVDNVAFRVRDTRVYIPFTGRDKVVVEYSEREASYTYIKAAIPSYELEDYTKYLRDDLWVSSKTPITFHELKVFEPRNNS